MVDYILDKILGSAKALNISKSTSIVIILLTAPLSGILTFHLQDYFKNWFINVTPIEISILGKVLGREYDLVPALSVNAIGLVIWFFLFCILRTSLDYVIDNYLIYISKKQERYVCNFTKLDLINFSKTWKIQGSPVLTNDGLMFTNSNSGCLIKSGQYWPLSKKLKKWKDFKAKIVVEFPRIFHVVNDQGIIGSDEEGTLVGWVEKKEEFRQVLGIVFGAQSLEDYFMLEVWRINDKL